MTVTVLLYWPKTAIPVARYSHVSPGSSTPVLVTSPLTKTGTTPLTLSVTLMPVTLIGPVLLTA